MKNILFRKVENLLKKTIKLIANIKNNSVLPKSSTGNIPVNKDLYQKYSNVQDMFNKSNVIYDGKINIEDKKHELNKIKLEEKCIGEIKKIAYDIFNKNNTKNIFQNGGNNIIVTISGINESIEKIYNNRKQRGLLKEHLLVFSHLGNIIEHAILFNQARNIKSNADINYWNYYMDSIKINNKVFKLEFDVRSMQDGQNQYRVQRLEICTKKQVNYDGDMINALPPHS